MREGRKKGYEQREADRRMRQDIERQNMTRKERKEAKKREKKRLKAKRARNKEFARVTYVFVGLFLVLLGYIGYFQVKKSQDIIRSPYNARQNSNAKRVTRGTIVDKNGNVLAMTTLDADLQDAAYQALGDKKGAVVAMEPKTGKILAMVSKPDFDPNTVEENWNSLSSDTNSVLLNRATQGQYAPGSTFKVVTLLEFMRENPDYSSYSYNCTGSIENSGIKIHCYNGHVHGQVNLQDSLAYSCNTSFSNIGLSLDPSKFKKTAEEVLFDSKLPSDLPYSKSSFTLDGSAGNGTKMMTAMGQGETQVSPYHMALITSAIANGGKLMKPYLVDKVTNASGAVMKETDQEEYKQLMTEEEASQIKEYMKSVVDYGTASVLSGQSYTAAGKTGTAEYSSDKEKDHSWFIGMSNVEDPELVVSVIIESSDGTAKAVNVAKEIFDSYYR